MDSLLIVTRLLLAAIFAVAGITKLLDLPGSRRAIRDFGVPTKFADPLGTLLPLAELTVTLVLLPASTAWWGAVGALVLLLLFVVGISMNLAQGRKPDCHCFGQLHSAPVGWQTLVRNGLLAFLAAFVVWQGRENVGPSALAWLSGMAAGEIVLLGITFVLGVLVAIEGWFLLHLLQQQGRLLLRIEALEARSANNDRPLQPPTMPREGLPVGVAAPAFQLPSLNGKTRTLDDLHFKGRPLMLIFSDPGCGPCNALMPEVAQWQKEYAEQLTVAVISRGTRAANLSKSQDYGLTNVLLQQDREVSHTYACMGTPGAVVIRDGRIESPLAMGADQIKSLVAWAVDTETRSLEWAAPAATDGCGCGNGRTNGHAPTDQNALKIGEPAPQFQLSDINGTAVGLDRFLGSETVLLFWNPNCGFCNRMLEDLKRWEANQPEGAPKLLIVSTGTVEINREMGLRSTIMLDEGFTVGHLFGVGGTPSAVLIDAQGNIASDVAIGAPSVLALIQTERAR